MFETDFRTLVDVLDNMDAADRLILLSRYCQYCSSIKLENELGELECLSCQEEATACPV